MTGSPIFPINWFESSRSTSIFRFATRCHCDFVALRAFRPHQVYIWAFQRLKVATTFESRLQALGPKGETFSPLLPRRRNFNRLNLPPQTVFPQFHRGEQKHTNEEKNNKPSAEMGSVVTSKRQIQRREKKTCFCFAASLSSFVENGET